MSTTTRAAHLTAFAAPLLALGATLAALGLSIKHLTGINLPGCGAESHCGQAASSAWGKVPLFDWPVSHLGVAYFAALTLALLISRANLTAPLRWIVRLGAIMSLVYIGVIVAKRGQTGSLDRIRLKLASHPVPDPDPPHITLFQRSES